MRRLLCILALVACGGRDPVAPLPPYAPLDPVDMDGVWSGTAGSQAVRLALSWYCPGNECGDVYVAGGYGTVGADSVHLTGRLHGDTLHIEAAPFYYVSRPLLVLHALVRPDTLTGQWTTASGTVPLDLLRTYRGPPH